MKKKVLTVIGTRPHFVKCSVVSAHLIGLGDEAPYEEVMVHTGQHYDPMLSAVFFSQFKLPQPKYNLNTGSVHTNLQAASVLKELTPILESEKPDAVLVYGDTVSTFAAAFCATNLGIPVAHVEAGERLYRRENLPEELNRVLTDNSAAINFTCTERASRFLIREGINPSRIRFTGDPMYDLFKIATSKLGDAKVTPASLGLEPNRYYLSTIHRKENTIDSTTLLGILEALDSLDAPVILPAHPKIQSLLANSQWKPSRSLKIIEPLGYFDFIRLLVDCKMCITDSGGAVKEAFFARKPAVAPMPSTAWPDIVDAGWIRCSGNRKENIIDTVRNFKPPDVYPEGMFGDGRAAEKIVDGIASMFCESSNQVSWHKRTSFEKVTPSKPSGLTKPAYAKMLGQLKENGYRSVGFAEAEKLSTSDPFVLLRHDVDMELAAAVEMARMERDLGVSATYFLLVSSEHYNLLTKENAEAVREIIALGHRIGLHFDPVAYDQQEFSALEELCRKEAGLIEQWFGITIDTVSFHRPSKAMQSAPDRFAGRMHTYSPKFTKEIFYVSDSRGEWGHGHPLDSEAFKRRAPLQILTHPIWWSDKPTMPYETLERFIDRRVEVLERSLSDNCTVFRLV